MSSSPAKPYVTYLLAFLAGAAGAVVGFLVTGIVALYFAGLAGVSDMEGGRGILAFLGIAPFGALAGLLAGILFVLRFRGGYRSASGLLGRGALVAAVLLVFTAMGMLIYALSVDDYLAEDGPPPQLHFEIRLPQGTTVPSGAEVELDTDKNTMPATFTASEDAGRSLLAGQVDLYFRTSSRILVMRAPGEPDRLFILDLAANPSASSDFGAWHRVDEIADGPDGTLRKANERDGYEIRYRVERANSLPKTPGKHEEKFN